MEIESKVTGSALTANEFNQIPDEMENLINKSGQTASSSDLTQITKAVSQFVADGDFYSTSGTANAIVLSAVSPRLAPTQLTNGFRARFIAQSDNTDTVTININNLGAKQVKFNGTLLGAGDLVSGKFYEVVYVASDDSLDLRTIDPASLLNKKMITNCILEAPNGVLETASTTYTLKAGVKLLISDGRNSDGTLKNIEHTITEDISSILPSNITYNFGYVGYNANTNGIGFVLEGHFLYGLDANKPSTVSDTLVHWYYAIDTNKWYGTSGSTTANWVYSPRIIVSTMYFSNNTIQSAKDTEVLQLATKNQLSGHWTNKGLTLAHGTQINAETTKTFDLTNYLPKYGDQYEVIVAVRGYTQNNTMLDYVAYSDIITNYIMLCRTFSRSSATYDAAGCATIPVGNKRKLYIRNTSQSASASNGFNAYVCGYRRLG